MQIQTGCIKTVLMQSGRLSHYVATLPIPKEIAGTFLSKDVFCSKNKWYYTYSSADWDEVWYNINLVQVTVNDWKVTLYEAKKLAALEKCVNYKTQIS